MATRSRKAVEPKSTSVSRVATAGTAATPSATGPKRATRSTRNAATPAEETSAAPKARTVAKKLVAEKPKSVTSVVKKAPARTKSKTLAAVMPDENDREPIKAFLRIRPNNLNDGSNQQESHIPYLKALSETSVQMTDLSSSRFRALSSIPPVTIYTFTHVFENTAQSPFFVRSALPLVQHLLGGENGLLFAYGVTNSGKTYSIQGGRGGGDEAGILPRSLDVIFNSIEGLHSERLMRPRGLGGVEFFEQKDATGSETLSEREEKASAMIDQVLGDGESSDMVEDSADATTLPVDKNYEYAVWLSYAEVYNEKIFDLLTISDGVNSSGDLAKSQSISGAISSYMNLAAIAASTNTASNVPVTLHRRALPLKSSPDGLGKYVQGLREVKVRVAEEAKAVVRMGTINRRVFGTLANAVSSRSHAVFTVRLVKIHRGVGTGTPAEEDITVSRLAIVDLAGSERARNAGTSRLGEGERLREAGNINKSLMVLGQCMEAMRTNQKRLAAAGATSPAKEEVNRTGLVEKPKLAIVPFRHSKITELFQDFFIGEGRAVMIININPYDTGFDENAHVMRFAALAREVTTNQTTGFPTFGVSRGPSFLPPSNAASRAPSRLASSRGIQSNTRRVMLSLGGNSRGGRGSVNTMVDVIEEDPDNVDGDEEEEQAYPLVDELFSRIEELEMKLYEAEMRAAMVETETREEVAQEMEERMQMMDKMYRERMSRENEENDRKTDEKMDLLHRALKTGGTISPVKKSRITEEEIVEDALMAPSSPDEVDMLEASPSARKSQPTQPTSPSKPKPTFPRKSARAASVEVSDNEEEPVVAYVPDLKRNPIMDMEEEEDAAMTDESLTEDSQAEEGEETSPGGSSEGDGETILSEENEEDSEEIEALEESDEEDEDQPTKFVFEPLRPPKAGNPIPPKSQRVVESSEEGESFAVDTIQASEVEEEPVAPPPKKAAKPTSKTKPASKKKAIVSTDEEMDKLTSKIGKTTLDTKGKGTRRSTRAKAG